MKIKHKSILLITYSIYIFPINSHANYDIKDMGNSNYKPFSISNNATQYYQLRNNKHNDIKYKHGKILDKTNYNQKLFTPFGSVYVYTAIDDDTLLKYNIFADNINNENQKELPSYDIRKSSFFNESILPSELFISTDGGITHKKINKGRDERLDTLYLDRISYNGEVIVGYATESKSRLTEITYNVNGCSGYPLCHTFIYNSRNDIFTILDNKINIHHLTKDGNFILYSSNKEKNLHIYDIAKKESFILSIENINHYLPAHPEKDILLLAISSPPILDKIKKRNVDIQKVSDNAQVIIGQLDRNLSKKQLIDAGYPKVAFITRKEGPIKEVSYSDFGSSKFTAFSENGNYSVGWGEIWHADYEIKLPHSIKKSSSLFSHALLYDFSNDKLKNIGNLSKKTNEAQFRNARAMDISADGQYIVGWSETDHYNYDTIPMDSSKKGPETFIIFHRHAFLYSNEIMYDLGTLDEGNDSEAHSITDDGRIIYGLSTDKHNNWRQVIWKSNKISNEYFNNEKQKFTDDAREKERLADKAKAEQERLAKEQADKAKAEQERLAKEQADKANAEQERLAKEQAEEKADTKPPVVISKPIDIENTYKSIQLVAENGYKLIDMQQGQLRYLASATCSVGTKKACISGFAHYQNVNKANATQTGLSGAYRFDINHIPLVVGLAIDTDISSSLPKGYQYQGYALPLIGFSLDLIPSLNAELNSNALHLSLKGAYLNRKVSIERQALADSESGKGNSKISGYHIDLQGSYPYAISNEFMLTPFVGLTFNQISRSAYSETQNAQFAAHYDALKMHSLLAKIGLGMDHLLGSSFILNTKAGLLWNLSHYQGNFRSHIDYLGQQQIDYLENKKQLKQRPFVHIGLMYQVDKHSSIGTKANWEMTTYRNHDMQFGIDYTYRF
ncbi:autotransporter domain-containing protein [Proteus vulgaris]|uniref:autotransporter domain-containing protein n=1 Tax=Proteus vulgaris TaxID=585 RepID=UPI0034D6E38B